MCAYVCVFMHACYKGIHSSCLVSRALLLTATDQTNNGRIKMIEKSDLSLENVSFKWQGETCSGSKALGLSIYMYMSMLTPKSCRILQNNLDLCSFKQLDWKIGAQLADFGCPAISIQFYFLLWPQFRKDQYNNRSMLNNKTTIIIWTMNFSTVPSQSIPQKTRMLKRKRVLSATCM